jgi:hypothetical protein
VSYDLNRTSSTPTSSTAVDNTDCGGTLTTLTDYNDWANLVFTGISDATFAETPKEVVSCDNPMLAEFLATVKPQQ